MKQSHQTVCALVSGGLDSCVMLAELSRRYQRVQPVYVRHGLRWESAELRRLRQFLAAIAPTQRHRLMPLRVLSMPVNDLYDAHWSLTGQGTPDAISSDETMYLPGRNLMLLAKAAVYCALHRLPAIAIGSLRGNPFTDATPQFCNAFARAAGLALRVNLRVIAPYRRMPKHRIIQRGVNLGLPLDLSFSCVSPRHGRHCGHCNKCAERQRAFAIARVTDPTRYAVRH